MVFVLDNAPLGIDVPQTSLPSDLRCAVVVPSHVIRMVSD